MVPDLASALPQVSTDGLTYRFPLREGISYSTGEPVRPEDFRHAVERSFTMRRSAPRPVQDDRRCEGLRPEPSTCDLSGSIVADAEAVTFHLVRPDPDLPYKLALPAAYPVPVEIPAEDQGLEPVPATGPYMIAEAGADGVELVRNPEFREWSGAAQPDGFVDAISWRFGQDPANAFDRLSAGELDWMTDVPQPEDLASLQAEHPDQVVVWPSAGHHLVRFQRSRATVRRRPGATGSELRGRPRSYGRAARRPLKLSSDVPGAPAELPGLRAVLPIHP